MAFYFRPSYMNFNLFFIFIIYKYFVHIKMQCTISPDSSAVKQTNVHKHTNVLVKYARQLFYHSMNTLAPSNEYARLFFYEYALLFFYEYSTRAYPSNEYARLFFYEYARLFFYEYARLSF